MSARKTEVVTKSLSEEKKKKELIHCRLDSPHSQRSSWPGCYLGNEVVYDVTNWELNIEYEQQVSKVVGEMGRVENSKSGD